MGGQIVWTGVLFLLTSVVLRKLSDDDVAKVPKLISVAVYSFFILGFVLIFSGFLVKIWY